MPIVTAVIPTFNMGVYVADAIRSVLGQTLRDVEIIVVDDGSTDDTPDVVATFGTQVQYLFQPNTGQGAARNRAIRAAKGKYVAFLDADDVWLADKLRRQVELLERMPNVALAGCGYSVRDERGTRVLFEVIRPDFPSHATLRRMLSICQLLPGSGSGVVVRRSCFEEVGVFDESLRIAQDWDMWVRLVQHFEAKFVPEVLLVIRKNSQKPGFRTLANEELYVGRVIEKNTPEHLKGHAYAVMHARLGSGYLSSGNPGEAQRQLIRSVLRHPGPLFPFDPFNRYHFPRTPRYYLLARASVSAAARRARRAFSPRRPTEAP
jgi:glycosyltransferase involved in cell wall biosynthesis